ncbi:MAG: hypothetical protein K0R93_1012 [Anaerosolibacter sp.]|jgi:hypothetical protein|uniref:hypothetical protein n=1 Tax=Anaerosolibacter sp. TaxID=1872527 RepID=UPI002626F436|nr:hypothetical protein [Anaerosolibacter sp.]MDF2546114.1 hypothetical protein [Anaerosolibacter sp.]
MDCRKVLESQVDILQQAQQRCLSNGSLDLVAPIAKQILEITMLLERYKVTPC